MRYFRCAKKYMSGWYQENPYSMFMPDIADDIEFEILHDYSSMEQGILIACETEVPCVEELAESSDQVQSHLLWKEQYTECEFGIFTLQGSTFVRIA